MKKLVLTSIFLLIFAGQACASWFNVQYNDNGNLFQDVTVLLNGNDIKTTAGEFVIDVYDSQTSSYRTFGYCVELDQGASNGFAELIDFRTYSDKNALEFNNYNKAAWLIDQNRTTAKTLVEKAGLQLAVWDAIYGDQLDINSAGNNPEIFNAYTSYFGQLTSWTNTPFNSEGFKIAEIISNGVSKQDLMVHSVPIPASLVLMSLGLAGISSARRKKNS